MLLCYFDVPESFLVIKIASFRQSSKYNVWLQEIAFTLKRLKRCQTHQKFRNF